MRQQVERGDFYKGDNAADNPLRRDFGSDVHQYVAIQRLGSDQFGWLAVLGILLLGTVLGTIRTSVGGSGIGFEAQHTVKLLRSTLRDERGRE